MFPYQTANKSHSLPAASPLAPFWMLTLLLLTSLYHPAWAAPLEVKVDGVRSNDGYLHVMIFDDPESFGVQGSELMVRQIPAFEGSITIVFPHLDAGRYAALVYHDEDDNQRLNRVRGTVPTEGWGLSRADHWTQDFDTCAFSQDDAKKGSMNVSLSY